MAVQHTAEYVDRDVLPRIRRVHDRLHGKPSVHASRLEDFESDFGQSASQLLPNPRLACIAVLQLVAVPATGPLESVAIGRRRTECAVLRAEVMSIFVSAAKGRYFLD